MKDYKSENIRNISVIGSAQIGKTTLGEAILFNQGITTRQGSVDDGTTILDFEADEAQRKIGISSSLYSIDTGANKMNFIDAPGYPGFVSQVITAVRACESSLVLICADSGVEILTRKNWKLSEKEGQSRFVFINRMERERVNWDTVLENVRTRLSSRITPILIPIGQGETFEGVVDILKNKAYYDNDKTEKEVPENMRDTVNEYRNNLMESAAETNEQLLNNYLENGELSTEELNQGIRAGIINGDIVPLMVGSAHKNIGVRKLLEILETLAPNPLEKNRPYITIEGDAKTENKIDPAGAPLGQVFKVTDDPKVGEYFFLKVLSGTFKASLELINPLANHKERIGHLYAFCGKNREEMNTAVAGDICAIAKLKSVIIGHTLSDQKVNKTLEPFTFPTPVISEAVNTESEKDREKMGEGLIAMNRMDPCFQFEQRKEFGEMIVLGQSNLQMEILTARIKHKYNIEIHFEKPKVSYRETITKTAKAQGKHKKQSGGHGQYGDCHIEIKPKLIGDGYAFVNSISGGAIPSKYIPAVDKGIQEAMSRGIQAGYPVVDVEVDLIDGTYHSVDSSDLAFQMAGIQAFKSAATQAGPIILEPIMHVEVIIPDEAVGDISADFNQRRGKILNMGSSEDEGYKSITALVPQSELYHYAIDLKSMTKGDALYFERFEKYEAVPAHLTTKIVEESKELDLVKA